MQLSASGTANYYRFVAGKTQPCPATGLLKIRDPWMR